MKMYSKSRAAKVLKVSRQTIYAMIARGELVPNDDGYVDLDQLPINTVLSKPGRKKKAKNEESQGYEDSWTKSGHQLESLIQDVRLLETEQNSALEKIRLHYEAILHRTLKLLEENVELIQNDREVIRLQNEQIKQLTVFYNEVQKFLHDRTKVIPVDSFNCPHCHRRILPPEEAHPEELLQLQC
jgi:hypothetical protein